MEENKNNEYDYLSIYARSFEELDREVTKLLNDGYRLYGYPYTTNTYIVQTLVKTPTIKIGEINEQ